MLIRFINKILLEFLLSALSKTVGCWYCALKAFYTSGVFKGNWLPLTQAPPIFHKLRPLVDCRRPMCSQNSESVMFRCNWRLTVAINRVDITKLIILHKFGIRIINFVFSNHEKEHPRIFLLFGIFSALVLIYKNKLRTKQVLGCHQMTTCRIYDGYCFNNGITVF